MFESVSVDHLKTDFRIDGGHYEEREAKVQITQKQYPIKKQSKYAMQMGFLQQLRCENTVMGRRSQPK